MSHSSLIILMMALASALLRFLPFFIFSDNRKSPSFIINLGNTLPLAAIGLLVVYCLKDVSFISNNHGIPEIIALLFVSISYYKTKSNLISIFGGTLIYLILVNFIFV